MIWPQVALEAECTCRSGKDSKMRLYYLFRGWKRARKKVPNSDWVLRCLKILIRCQFVVQDYYRMLDDEHARDIKVECVRGENQNRKQ